MNPEPLLKLATAYWTTKILTVATELELFSKLSKTPQGLNQITQSLNLDKRPVHAILNACVALDLLKKPDGKYENTELSDTFLVKDKPGYMGDFIIMQGTRLYDCWGHLSEAVRTNKPYTSAFEGLQGDPEMARNFTKAMHNNSMGAAAFLAANHDFSNCKTLLDLGGGSGAFSIMIAMQNPHLKIVLMEFANVCDVASEFIDAFDVESQVAVVTGDIMHDEYPGCDTILLSNVLHAYGPADCQKILQKTYAVLPQNGEIIINDFILEESKTAPLFAAMFAINMLVETEEGAAYSKSEISQWLQESGFRQIEVQDMPGPAMAIVAKK